MGHLAGGAHLLFDWIQKPDRGAGELGMDVFDVYARGAADHRGPTPARVAGPHGGRTGPGNRQGGGVEEELALGSGSVWIV